MQETAVELVAALMAAETSETGVSDHENRGE
jgi:hypothetical protein